MVCAGGFVTHPIQRVPPGVPLLDNAEIALDAAKIADPLAAIGEAYAALPVGGALRVNVGGAWDAATLAFLAEQGGFTPDATQAGWYHKHNERRWRLSRLRPEDQAAVEGLFDRVFQQPMNRPFWDWKYAEGRGANVLAWHKDEVVAHYGGIRRAILHAGQPASAWQIADVMVASRERGVLTRQGAFYLTAAAFAALHINPTQALSFGFPSERHTALGERLGLYARVDTVLALRWPALLGVTLPRLQPVTLLEWPRWAGVMAALWQRMAHDLAAAIVGVRDAPWLRQRYLLHPEHQYQIYLVGDWLPWRWRGLIVLRREGETLTLIDLVAPLASLPVLLRTAQVLAAQQGAQWLAAWVSAPFVRHFAEGAVLSDPNIPLPVITWGNTLDPQALQGRWWLLAGDSDYR